MNLLTCSEVTFKKHITEKPEDNFAKTFVAKANLGNYWDRCYGFYDHGELCGAIITTISKSKTSPKIANLQLLHTFSKHRRKGVAKALCNFSLKYALFHHAEYFRVSAEPSAVLFYKKIGFKMLGKQKSEAQLSMFRITGDTFKNGVYDIKDHIIHKAVHKKGRGGCIEIF